MLVTNFITISSFRIIFYNSEKDSAKLMKKKQTTSSLLYFVTKMYLRLNLKVFSARTTI